MSKASIPKGTRDFLPSEAKKRAYLFDTIKAVFESHGYDPIETPAMEHLQTLLGKYGEEGDRLIFKILKRGDKFKAALQSGNDFADQALRYDLTVPFARFVVQHRSDLSFPFKRYQMQPVWRADRPQKGRYREFYQCDVDCIGTESLHAEVELLQIIETVFDRLGLSGVEVRLNNRKILMALAQYLNAEERLIEMTVIIDKLDKIGLRKVCEELSSIGFADDQIKKLVDIITLTGNPSVLFESLTDTFAQIPDGLKGVEELQFLFDMAKALNIKGLKLDLSLARGLNYYTGAIFEVTHPDFKSSICGGGRYDDLTSLFGLEGMSGVGISFGADRIYDLLEQKGLFDQNTSASAQVLFANFGEQEVKYAQNIAAKLRAEGIACEVYLERVKMKKQFSYAHAKNIPHVLSIGSEEIGGALLPIKNMASGETQKLSLEAIISLLNSKNDH